MVCGENATPEGSSRLQWASRWCIKGEKTTLKTFASPVPKIGLETTTGAVIPTAAPPTNYTGNKLWVGHDVKSIGIIQRHPYKPQFSHSKKKLTSGSNASRRRYRKKAHRKKMGRRLKPMPYTKWLMVKPTSRIDGQHNSPQELGLNPPQAVGTGSNHVFYTRRNIPSLQERKTQLKTTGVEIIPNHWSSEKSPTIKTMRQHKKRQTR